MFEDDNGVLKKGYLIYGTYPANQGYLTVNFPSGKFNSSPYIIGTSYGPGKYLDVANISNTSCLVYVRDGGGTVPTIDSTFAIMCIGN